MIKRTKLIGNRLFCASCEEQLSLQADWLLDLLQRLENEKGSLKDGSKIQVGWTILTIRQSENEAIVLAPDYNKNPFVDTTEDLTLSLFVQLKQNYCLNRMKLDGEPALFQDKFVAAAGALQTEHVYLERSNQRVAGDSGWYLGRVEGSEQDQSLEAYYVFQLLKLRPSLLQALAIPRGHLVVFNGNEIEAVLDDKDMDLWQSAEG